MPTIQRHLERLAALDVYIRPYTAYALIAFFCGFFFLEKGLHRDLFYVAGLVPMLIFLHPRHLRDARASRLWQLTAAASLVSFAGIFWSTPLSAENVFDAVRGIAATMIFLTGAVAIARSGHLRVDLLLSAFAVAALVSGVITLVWFAREPVLEGTRLIGMGWGASGPNFVGIIYAVATLVAVHQARSRSNLALRVMCGCAVAVAAACVILSGSRAAVAALLPALLVLLVFQSRRRDRGVHLVLGLAVVGIGLAGAAVLVGVEPMSWVERGFANRLELWRFTASRIAEAPLFGHGSETVLPAAEIGIAQTHPHNILLATLYRTGIVGLVVLGTLFVHALVEGVRQARHHDPIALALLCFALAVMMVQPNKPIDTPNYLWLVFWMPIVILSRLEGRSLPRRTEADTADAPASRPRRTASRT